MVNYFPKHYGVRSKTVNGSFRSDPIMLGKIVDHAATLDKKGLSINLHSSLDTPLASITNLEPFEGKLEVIPHRDGPVRVRRPAYASRIEAEIDATPIVPQEENSYLTFATCLLYTSDAADE